MQQARAFINASTSCRLLDAGIDELWGDRFAMLGERTAIVAATGLRPQDRFTNAKAYRLLVDHTFCAFAVDAPREAGVYAWWVDGELVYIGRASSLRNRLSAQYGRVSPRHPFEGGQIQKCRINSRLNLALAGGKLVEVSWRCCEDFQAMERHLLEAHRPPWNIRRARPGRE